MKARGNPPRRAGEGIRDVAIRDGGVRHQIVRAVLPRPRRAGRDRRRRIDHSRQRLVVDFDQPRRVLGDAPAVRHHDADRLADVADFPVRKPRRVHVEPDRSGRHGQRDAIAGHQRAQVRIGQHRVDAGQAARRRHVNPHEQGMRHRAPHEGRMERSGNPDVVHKGGGAAQQPAVLDPRHAVPEGSGDRFVGADCGHVRMGEWRKHSMCCGPRQRGGMFEALRQDFDEVAA